MTGGASLWRANWSERDDPFADVARGTGRGPGWQRAQSSGKFSREPVRIVEARAADVERDAAAFQLEADAPRR